MLHTVLQSIPWDKVDIQVIIIEVHYEGKIFESKEEETIKSFLEERDFKFIGSLHINQVFVRNDFVPQKLERPFIQYFRDTL